MKPRILFISPKYYGIEDEIVSHLTGFGYDVVPVENKSLKFDYHGNNARFRLFRRIYFLIFRPHSRYIEQVFRTISEPYFDLLFAINCHSVSPFLFKLLRKYNPSIRSVLYLWDSLSVYSWKKEIRLFDKTYSFDKIDSLIPGIEYKPNFFLSHNHEFVNYPDHHLFFAGKFNLRRLCLIDEIIKSIENQGIDFYIRLLAENKRFGHNTFVYKILKFFSWTSLARDYVSNFEATEGILLRDFILHNSIDYSELRRHLNVSNVVLDIEYHGQNGYSHRLIEALSLGKKLITTNQIIRDESFFNGDQVKVISENFQDIDIAWIRERATFPVPDSIADSELSKWLLPIVYAEVPVKAA